MIFNNLDCKEKLLPIKDDLQDSCDSEGLDNLHLSLSEIVYEDFDKDGYTDMKLVSNLLKSNKE